jgi:uncharacterized membrane protein YdjX (TVP38/TMEM64 family)
MPELAKSPAGRRELRRRLVILMVILVILVGLALAWSWSPLRQWLDVSLIVAKLEQFGMQSGPILATLGFAGALTVAVPLTFLTLVTLVAFGPWQGFLIAIAGAALGAATSFLAGKIIGHEVVLRLGGPRVNVVSQRLANHGILAVVAVRMVPIAPFAIVNMIAGATHLRLRDMIVGTAIGMTPGTLIMMFFVDRILEALNNPSSTTVLIGGIMAVLIVGGIFGMRKWLEGIDH